MTQILPASFSALERPDPSNLDECWKWISARYLKNRRDDAFMVSLKSILSVDASGTIVPEPVYDPLSDEVYGLAVLGESGEGKSSLIRRNLGTMPNLHMVNEQGEGNYLYVKIENEPSVKALTKLLLERSGYGRISHSAKGDVLWTMLLHRISLLGIKLIWIDEAHHVFRPGPGRDLVSSLRAMKTLLKGQNAPAIILSGIPQLNEHLVKDRETSRRFFRHTLNAEGLGTEDIPRLRKFIEQCCISIGMTPPKDPSYVERLLFANNQSLGNTLFLVKHSIRYALNNRHGALDLDVTRTVFESMGSPQGLGPFSDIEWPKLKKTLKDRGWS